ncbi:hypothetical protein D3C76_1713580 [compost metagenome]
MANLLYPAERATAFHVARNQGIAQVQVGLAEGQRGQGTERGGVHLQGGLWVALADLLR